MRINTFALAMLALAVFAMTFSSAASAAETCWSVFWKDEAPAATDNADEVICMSSDTDGVVRESSIFGTGVEGCNKVTAKREGEAVTFVVDYSKCTNDSPSHTMGCKGLTDVNKCIWTYTSGDYAGQTSSAYLIRPKQ